MQLKMQPSNKSRRCAKVTGRNHVAGFKLLADEIRLRLLSLIAEEPRFVGELIKGLDAEQSLVSHHLKLLREGRFLKCERIGRQIRYHLADGVSYDKSNQEFQFGCCSLKIR